MFQSVTYELPHKVVNQETGAHEITIVDSNFSETVQVTKSFVSEALGTAVMEVYERRKLPVAGNYLMAIQYVLTTEKIWYPLTVRSPLEQLLLWEKKNNPHFSKYEKDIKKLLLFL